MPNNFIFAQLHFYADQIRNKLPENVRSASVSDCQVTQMVQMTFAARCSSNLFDILYYWVFLSYRALIPFLKSTLKNNVILNLNPLARQREGESGQLLGEQQYCHHGGGSGASDSDTLRLIERLIERLTERLNEPRRGCSVRELLPQSSAGWLLPQRSHEGNAERVNDAAPCTAGASIQGLFLKLKY